MRKFIYKTSIFIFIPITIAFFLDIFISEKLKSVKDFPCENEVWNDIYSSSINADLAIIGSSRAWVHFNPEILEDSLNIKCYNLGEDGSNILLQYLRFKEYSRFNSEVSRVILSVDLWTLRSNENTYPTSRFYPYMLWNTSVYNILKSVNKNKGSLGKFYVPMLRFLNKKTISLLIDYPQIPYFQTFDQYFELNDLGRFRSKGYKGLDLSWKETEKDYYQVDIDSQLIAIMETFIEELQTQKIEVIMVYPPEYKEGQPLTKNRKEIISTFRQISKKFNLPFYDYSDHALSEEKSLFYNVQHLNKKGATAFTQDLVKALK